MDFLCGPDALNRTVQQLKCFSLTEWQLRSSAIPSHESLLALIEITLYIKWNVILRYVEQFLENNFISQPINIYTYNAWNIMFVTCY